MFHNYLHALTPIIGLIVNLLFQIISVRFISKIGLLKSILLGFVMGILSVYILTLLTPIKDVIEMLITNLIIYAALGYGYFHFINLGETARRVRILRELYDAKEGLSMQEILGRYNAKEIVEKRINRLMNNRQIIYRDNKYYIGSPAILIIAKAIVALKLIILGEKSEFD